jgi:hypothetical protein
MRVTFDSNTLDKVVRPNRFPKDPDQPDFHKVHQALREGKVQGFFSETIITLEGIQKKDRVSVFSSTQLRQGDEEDISTDSANTTIKVSYTVEQPDRQPLHAEISARISEAIRIGLKLLKAPRIGNLRILDPDGKYFVTETDAARAERLSVYDQVLREIEDRGVGYSVVKTLATKLSARDGVTEPWYRSLARARDVHEENAVKRAIAEWADGDSIAAHIAYGIDYFCTGDLGNSSGSSSILDQANRAWLSAKHGVHFVTVSQLASLIKIAG